MKNNITHRNHYVPQWYQANFLLTNFHQFYYLDKFPEKLLAKNGKYYERKSILRRGPINCFKQDDLYTINIFDLPLDIIEKELFGQIDINGSISFPVVIENQLNSTAMKAYDSFIEFIDSQKIRTPKGLEWLKYQVSAINNVNDPNSKQILLMDIMRKFRRINRVMWGEGVWEIVSCKSSSVKFIISDHPVTTYNVKLYPGSRECVHPNDPSILYNGTRTIYPLDLNHCLIISHRDYCLEPRKINPLSQRINARYAGSSIFAPLDIIRNRELSEDEVIIINFIIKTRAYRYIAGSDINWIYPEKYIKNSNWSRFDKILNPPREMISITQSIILGYNDGRQVGYDSYGRPIDVSKQKDDIEKILELRKQKNKVIMA